jgi:hypothetical protein
MMLFVASCLVEYSNLILKNQGTALKDPDLEGSFFLLDFISDMKLIFKLDFVLDFDFSGRLVFGLDQK